MAIDIDNEDQNPSVTTRPAQAAPGADVDDSSDAGDGATDDGGALKGSVNLHRAYSKINEALIRLADHRVRRSVSVPHIEGENMAAHLDAVGKAASQVGGLTTNLMLATHSQHDPDGGVTAAYPASKLRDAIIPKDDSDAIAAIKATDSFVSKVQKLLGDTAQVQTAKSQMKIIGQQNGEGMSVADLVIALVNVPHPLIQSVARAHSRHKHGSVGHPRLTAPKN